MTLVVGNPGGAVQEAANSHTYEAKGEVHEHWTGFVENPDWLMEAS